MFDFSVFLSSFLPYDSIICHIHCLFFISIISCILDKCTFITHVTMLLLCVKTKTKTLAAQLAPAANKQCKIVGAGAEALLYFSTFWFFTPHFITNLTHQIHMHIFPYVKSCLPYTLVQSFSVLFYRI